VASGAGGVGGTRERRRGTDGPLVIRNGNGYLRKGAIERDGVALRLDSLGEENGGYRAVRVNDEESRSVGQRGTRILMYLATFGAMLRAGSGELRVQIVGRKPDSRSS